MHVSNQDLEDFKICLINEDKEAAWKILATKLNQFKNEIKTPVDIYLKNLPHNDFTTCLIPDVKQENEEKGQHLVALKATSKGNCLGMGTVI